MFDEEILRLFVDITRKVKPKLHETHCVYHVGHISISYYTNGTGRGLYRAYPKNHAWLIKLEHMNKELTNYDHEGIDPTDDLIWLKMKV